MKSLPLFIIVALLLMGRPACAITAGRLPGDTITNQKGTTLQYNVCNEIFASERRLAPACHRPRVIKTAIVGEPRRLNFGRMMQWTEQWTIDRCGANAIYMIRFDFRGSVGSYKIAAPRS